VLCDLQSRPRIVGEMKQILQNYKTGELQLIEVPPPTHARRGHVLVQTRASVVSVGTERAMIDIARKSLLGKAQARPDWVRQVVDKVRTEGPLEAYRQSMARLEKPMPLGYSSAGVVVDVGEGVTEFAVGDRVACAGSGYVCHAEIVSVPRNLVVKIPQIVSGGAGEHGSGGAQERRSTHPCTPSPLRKPLSWPWAASRWRRCAWPAWSWATGWRSLAWGSWGSSRCSC